MCVWLAYGKRLYVAQAHVCGTRVCMGCDRVYARHYWCICNNEISREKLVYLMFITLVPSYVAPICIRIQPTNYRVCIYTRMLLVCTRMLLVCTRMLPVCTRMSSRALFFTRMYSYVSRILLVFTCMLLVCTRLLLVCYSYLFARPRMYSLCVTRMLAVMYSYVTRMYSYVTVMY